MRQAFAWLARYASHPDPLAATANLVAMVLAWNTPFYWLYVAGAAGRDTLPTALLTLISFPFFAAIPALARANPLLGRAMLPVVGTANTVFCAWVFGDGSGTELFLLPCLTLAIMLFRAGERRAMVPAVAMPVLAYLVGSGRYGAGLAHLHPAQLAALASLNAISVGALTMFLAIVFSRQPRPS